VAGLVAEAAVSARGAARWNAGHPWIYRSDVASAPTEPGIVSVHDTRGRFLGQALHSPRSEIRLRLLTRERTPVDQRWWTARIAERRERRVAIDGNAWRAVHGEGDGLPSLIVDRYDRWLVAQLLSAGLETCRADIVEALLQVYAPEGILLRNDVAIRKLEGLEQHVELVHGAVPEQIEVREGAIRWIAAPWTGQKTGAFLDQRDNRCLAGALVAEGGTALDCFSYHGSFALHLAARASTVVALDVSEEALARGRQNAERNGLENIEFVAADAFDQLATWHREGRTFDLVVVDPPAFAKAKGQVAAALRGYHEINRRAMRLLAPGGRLVSASCSFHVRLPAFVEMIANAAATSGRRLALERVLGQPADHPEVVTIPETGYLKGVVLRAD
jgi:23S rRNA (cytosine1962-C5)-methyltransferase